MFLLLACTGPEPKDSPTGDPDGDGYLADDCGEGDAEVHPGAVEVCDGLDNNCDGLTDEADPALDLATALEIYQDDDLDGWGTGEPTWSCTPAGTSTPGDCDDTRGDVNPGADEVCDPADTDEDCDGKADDADPDVAAAGQAAYWADADGDGWGSGSAAQACDPPKGSAAAGGDCNDGNAAIHPAAGEVCDSRDVDEDCDGLVDDDDDVDPTSATEVWDDDDDDSYGAGASSWACDVGEGQATRDGDCDDGNARVNPSAAEVCDGIDTDEDCDGLADDDDASTNPGTMTDRYGDSDGDGSAGTLVGQACEVPAGSRTAEDCNDADAAVHPGAGERCDDADVDEDCDGRVDDDDTDVDPTTASGWYVDADGDGYGSASAVCDPTGSEVDNDDDCDDTDADVSPADADGDGTSGCDGDCDDTDATALSSCTYTSVTGWFGLEGCSYDLAGAPTSTSTCPDCEYVFDLQATVVKGSCIAAFDSLWPWDADAGTITFYFDYYGTFYALGTFGATLTEGSDADTLTWSGLSSAGLPYYGAFYLY